MSRKISPRLQQYLAQLDKLQNTYVAIASQKQTIDTQLIEVKNALNEVEKTEEGREMYKVAGNILIRVDRKTIRQELTETKNILEIRQKTLQNEIERLKREIERLNGVVSKMLKEEGIVK